MAETSPRVLRLLHDLRGGRAHVVDDFWQEVKAQGTPLVEAVDDDSALVTFLWRGDAAYTATAFGVDVVLRRLDGTDLWYGSQRLPLNRHLFRFPADRHDLADYPVCLSLLELPSAPVEPWSRPLPGVARGSLLTTSIRTIALGGRRRIVVYRPAGKPKPVALLVVFDGFHSRTVLRIPTTLDNLIAAGRIPPTMALFVTTPSGKRRDTELRPRRALRDFVVRELLPWARHRWCISDDPQARIVAGASLGALAAAYVGMLAPREFGCVLSQSGSYWWPAPPAGQPEWLTHAFANRPRLPLRLYMDVGDRETTNPVGEGLEMLAVNRRFRDVLTERGYSVTYAEYSGWHDYINWRRTFADGLVALIGK